MEALITDGWTLNAAVGLLDAEFLDFPGGATDSEGNAVNLKGNTVGGAPKNSFYLGTQYNLPLESLNAVALFRVDYSYTGEKYSDGNHKNEDVRILDTGVVLDDFLYSDHTSNLNARVGLMATDGRWSVSIWGRNLTDENYTLSSFSVFSSYGRTDMLPRTYGIELSYNF